MAMQEGIWLLYVEITGLWLPINDIFMRRRF